MSKRARRFVYYVVYNWAATNMLGHASVDFFLDSPITTMEQVNDMCVAISSKHPDRRNPMILNWILLREEDAPDEQ
jgi:hypothetical protein